MNRREFLTSTGTIALGSGVAVNALSRSALAFEASINDTATIPENVNDPQVNLSFDTFEVTASKVEDVTVTLNAALDGKDLIENVDSVSKKLDNPNGVNDLSDVSLFISTGENKENIENELDLESELSDLSESESLKLTVEIIVETSELESVSTGEKNVKISITSPETPGSEVDYFERDNFTDYWSVFSGSYSTTTNSEHIYEGTHSVRATNGYMVAGSSEGDGLPYYPKIGDRVLLRVRHDHSNAVPQFNQNVNDPSSKDDRHSGLGFVLSARDNLFGIDNGTNEWDSMSHSWNTGQWYLVDQNSAWDGDDIEFRLVVYDGPTLDDPVDIEYTNTFTPNFNTSAQGMMIFDHHDGEDHTWDRIIAEPDGAVLQ